MNNKLPITRLSKFFSKDDFDINIQMGQEYLHGDLNMKLVLYRVDRSNTDTDSVYAEVGKDEIKYFPPVEFNALVKIEEPKNNTYKSGLLRYSEPGNLTLSVYISHLEELRIDIRYGDFIGYADSEDKVRYYTVTNDGRVTSDNKHKMFGYKPHYRTITCVQLKKQNSEEFKMGIPKRKNNIDVYGGKEVYQGKQVMDRRQELLDRITNSDSYMPDSVLHDDLDGGMLDFIKTNFKVISDGTQIPIIPKILTIQRWGEFTNNWSFSDDDGNMKLPFIAVIRKPDVQPGTNPSIQRTIPDRQSFHYATVPTWNGSQMGADIYKMPQPVAIDISFEVSIICTKFRDLNRFNKIVLQKFSSRQSYTSVKGHYIPIVLDSIDDNTPMDTVDGRRFYMQNYKFTMLGFLIDSEEFEVKPAVSRMFLMNEFIQSKGYQKKYINKTIDITVATFPADGLQTAFSVGESIGILFNVTINGLIQERDVDYFHIPGTSKVTFASAPLEGSSVTITYFKGRNSVFIDSYGKPIQVTTEYFTYDGSSLSFTVLNTIDSVVTFDINGLVEDEGVGFEITSSNEVTIQGVPVLNSRIGVTYLY